MINRQTLRNGFTTVSIVACFVGPCIMVLSDAATIILNQKVNPIEQTISGFATGPYGWLEKIGIGMVGLPFLFIGSSLLKVRGQKYSRRLKSVGVLYIIAAFLFVITGIFNTTAIINIHSFRGMIHILSLIVASAIFYPSCLLFMRLMVKKPNLRGFGIYSGFTYLVGLAAGVWIAFSFHHHAYMGLFERILAGFTLLWIVFVGTRVIKQANELVTETH